jgi:hypothetical protein
MVAPPPASPPPVEPPPDSPPPASPPPVEPPPEVYFELIATLDNEHERPEEGRGYAAFLDPDVVDGGEYDVLIGYQDADDGYAYTEPAEFTINYTAPEAPSTTIHITLNLKLGLSL